MPIGCGRHSILLIGPHWAGTVKQRLQSRHSVTTLLRNVLLTLTMYFSGDHSEIYLIDKVSIKSYVRLVNGINS